MHEARPTPLLSIIVIGYRMSRQLENTLYSLSNEFQRNCDASSYEVIVVENESDDPLNEKFLNQLTGKFRYFLRAETSHSPVSAVNFAFQQCRGEYVGLIIDGARMLSPRTVEYTLMANAMTKDAIVMVPGYHIGQQEQHLHNGSYTFEQDQQLMQSVDWKNNGYNLFNVSTFSNGNRRGFLQPMMECSCIFASLKNFEKIGYADSRFMLAGGGAINLHIYRSLGMLPNSKIIVLAGEGSFHQFHGGVTTSHDEARDDVMDQYTSQLNALWPDGFQALRKEPTLLGSISKEANAALAESCKYAETRFNRLHEQKKPQWPDD